MSLVEKNKIKSLNIPLKEFTFNDKDYLTVTEWSNGEGWDITIGDRMFNLHSGELRAINYLTTMLDYDYN